MSALSIYTIRVSEGDKASLDDSSTNKLQTLKGAFRSSDFGT